MSAEHRAGRGCRLFLVAWRVCRDLSPVGTGSKAEHGVEPTRDELAFYWFPTLPWRLTPVFGSAWTDNKTKQSRVVYTRLFCYNEGNGRH